MDELDMATTRMRLRLPDEVKSDIPQSNVLEIEEVIFTVPYRGHLSQL